MEHYSRDVDSLPEGERFNFAQSLEDLRPALRAYLFSILPHPDAADDVLQETSLFLWEHRADFQVGTNFRAWAFKTAYFKALSQRRELQRRKVITLSEDVLHRIAGAAEERVVANTERLEALRLCLKELRAEDLQMLHLKYVEKGSLTERAQDTGVPPNRLQKAISRLRLSLRHCIENRISQSS